jgi:TolA-binding protein
MLKANFALLTLDSHYGEQYDFGREIGHVHNPETLIFTPDGAVISHTHKVLSTEEMLAIIRDVLLAYQPLKDAQKAHKKEPEAARANYGLGCALFNSGKKDKDAKKHLERYLELDKENKEGLAAEAYFRLGVMELRAKKGDKKKVEEHFKKAVELDKDSRRRMKERADWEKVKSLQKDKKKAAEYKKALRKHVDSFPKSAFVAQALMMIADICVKARDIEGAVDAWLELQKKRFGSIEYPEMRKLLAKYWNQSRRSKK